MQIDTIICSGYLEEKIETKHHVSCQEVNQLLFNRPRIRFAEKGRTEGDDVYVAFGQTFEGRYLMVFFIYKSATKVAIVISARDMSDRERKNYGRK